MGTLSVRAPAKINLCLDLLGRRADGYHELRSIMQTLTLSDELRFETFQAAPSEGTTRFSCSVPELMSHHNLAYRAVLLMRSVANQRGLIRRDDGLSLHLVKRIPSAAGLGGGSSDAAAVIRTLNELWELHLPVRKLQEIASSLGSDVPFFIEGGAAFVSGRGERVEKLPPFPHRWVLLVSFEQGLSTQAVYAAVTPDDMGGKYVDMGMSDSENMERWVGNALAKAALRLRPELSRWLASFRACGAPVAEVSGSGPTLFALFKDRPSAERVMEQMKKLDLPGQETASWYLTQFLQAEEREHGD